MENGAPGTEKKKTVGALIFGLSDQHWLNHDLPIRCMLPMKCAKLNG
jgi:hypothetical protein